MIANNSENAKCLILLCLFLWILQNAPCFKVSSFRTKIFLSAKELFSSALKSGSMVFDIFDVQSIMDLCMKGVHMA